MSKLKIETKKHNKFLILFLFISIMIGILIYKNVNTLLSLIIPGYENNFICENHKLIATQVEYEIPAAKNIGKGMILKVERWGNFSYSYSSIGKSIDTNKCEAASAVTPDDEGVILSINNNLNSGPKRVLTFTIDLRVEADTKSNKPYNAEKVIESLAHRFELIKETKGKIILRPKAIKPDEDTSYIGGSWVFHKYNNKYYYDSYSFELISIDNGQTWNFSPGMSGIYPTNLKR